MIDDLLGKTVRVTINSSLWSGTVVQQHEERLVVQLIELLRGNSILKPGHRMDINLDFPPSPWATKQGFRVLAAERGWL